ncbi:tellurite resistance/C4-dicarboxylate transporter family protein [Mycolicibacterium komossense]|uniref:Tellurite resistance/C4-dicarboxylate transporter family protein n=2 Tax=Mycolicibacterium komossense TaxID=1779 RepID=A0ABT3CMB1_9MYCO|nr:tellurite resistance/C4-dicarboxylate transporter family protein [Mycolicibacterium komossense]
MATGIVSIAAADHGYRWISLVLAALALVALPVLTWLSARSIGNVFAIEDPDVLVRLFSFVAACAVLGARFASNQIALWVLAAMALLSWLLLVPAVGRRIWKHRWLGLRDRAHGAWELASVATSGIAIVAADLRIVVVALLFWALAIAVYGLMTGFILWRAFHERLDPGGFEPDGWILMGGLAIATLAGDHLHRVWASGVIEIITLITWALATAWIPVLVYFGIRRINEGPGALQFRGVWWAMVFPLGMYSAATFAMSGETRVAALATVSLVFFWVAFAVWLIVACAGLLRLLRFRRVFDR